MRILIVHNLYQQPGGEDAVVKNKFRLLKDFGEDVYLYERSNLEFSEASCFKKMKLLLDGGWSRDSYRDIRAVLKEIRPDVVHFHNIFYILTPAVYQACRDENIPVVVSLHNFRLLCSNALLFRDNKVCEECIERGLNRGIYHRCFKRSRLLTAAVVRMMKQYWQKGTWINLVDHYIMASEFGRQKHIAAGIPKEKISIKPHVVYPDSPKSHQDRGYVLCVGRLSEEKGIRTLLEAWKEIDDCTLKIAGEGPLEAELKLYVRNNNIVNVEFLGFISGDQYHECMQGAKFLIVPSVCYENFPRMVVEAYSYGLPVVASSLGSFPEIVEEKKTGLLFKSANDHDLAEKIQWALTHEVELDSMRKNVREQYKEKYSGRKNYEILMDVYRRVIQ
ncbi:MAG: glycosyltransferase [Candidatus Omnitrophica bacterium]|nr:glycosyltransferase [Candidatus Omnitrophota bacterium]